VLRLWPDTVHVGLFGDHGWVQHGKAPLRVLPAAGDGQPLSMLEALLDDLKDVIARGTRVVLTVSDAFAAITTIAWHGQLREQAELQRFAQLCFEQQGREVDSSWAMYAQYRHFGAAGMAWAVQRTWLAEAERIVMASGARLARVQPASAAAYQLVRPPRGKGYAIVLLRESRRCTVLHVGQNGLQSMDVEPVTISTTAAVTRLLKRTVGVRGNILHVADWHARLPDAQDQKDIVALLGRELPDATVSTILHAALR
jgi:hypothetical protein